VQAGTEINCDRGPAIGKFNSNCVPDPFSCAGDQGDFALERFRLSNLFLD